jgi:hypothetical protein
LTDTGILLEEARVNQVHTAGVGNIVINQNHFAVLAKIHAPQENTQQINLQRLNHFYTGIAHHSRPRAAEKRDAASRIQHQAAVNTATSGGHQ